MDTILDEKGDWQLVCTGDGVHVIRCKHCSHSPAGGLPTVTAVLWGMQDPDERCGCRVS